MTPTAVRQVSLNAGDLETTLSFWEDVLGLTAQATFEESGLGFISINGVRLIFQPDVAPGTVYLDVRDVDSLHALLKARDIQIISGPSAVFTDTEGVFGTAGETEWMLFVKDPARNTIGLVTRRFDVAKI